MMPLTTSDYFNRMFSVQGEQILLFYKKTGYKVILSDNIRLCGPPKHLADKYKPGFECMVIINKLPIDAFEPEIFHFASGAGKIYQIGLKKGKSGEKFKSCFIKYCISISAKNAVKHLDRNLRPGVQVSITFFNEYNNVGLNTKFITTDNTQDPSLNSSFQMYPSPVGRRNKVENKNNFSAGTNELLHHASTIAGLHNRSTVSFTGNNCTQSTKWIDWDLKHYSYFCSDDSYRTSEENIKHMKSSEFFQPNMELCTGNNLPDLINLDLRKLKTPDTPFTSTNTSCSTPEISQQKRWVSAQSYCNRDFRPQISGTDYNDRVLQQNLLKNQASYQFPVDAQS
uniref:RRM domain-containing protein n=1 Tax=Clastoptera arizonana TaxID=38151 RepID=A0A1B6DCP8_9HEMI